MDSWSPKEVLNETTITVISTVLILLLGIYYLIQRRYKDLPPGPTGFPIIGYWPFIKEEAPHLHLTELSKKYGDIYSFTVVGKLFVHLGSIKLIKEAQIKKSDCFMERSSEYSIFQDLFRKGLIALNGEEWTVLRKFIVQSFKEYGLISLKEYMAGPIDDSVNSAIESLIATGGSPVNIIEIINDRSLDMFRSLMFNDEDVTSEELKAIVDCYKKVLSVVSEGTNNLLIGQIARIFFISRIKNYKVSLDNHQKMTERVTALVKRHEKTYKEGIVRDVVDAYFKERNEKKQKGDPTAKYFTDEALISTFVQIIGDAVMGISFFLGYFIHALLEYPEEQEKIYKEIQDVVGPDRQVFLGDRNKLSYTNAFIQEVVRTSDFFPILPGTVCSRDTTLGGYRIPKGAITIINLWGSQHDPNVFEEPDKFKPSRYVNEPGKPKAELPCLFGIGKRSCPGEPFTMMQVFLYVTNMVKSVRLEKPKGDRKIFFMDGQIEVCVFPRK